MSTVSFLTRPTLLLTVFYSRLVRSKIKASKISELRNTKAHPPPPIATFLASFCDIPNRRPALILSYLQLVILRNVKHKQNIQICSCLFSRLYCQLRRSSLIEQALHRLTWCMMPLKVCASFSYSTIAKYSDEVLWQCETNIFDQKICEYCFLRLTFGKTNLSKYQRLLRQVYWALRAVSTWDFPGSLLFGDLVMSLSK